MATTTKKSAAATKAQDEAAAAIPQDELTQRIARFNERKAELDRLQEELDEQKAQLEIVSKEIADQLGLVLRGQKKNGNGNGTADGNGKPKRMNASLIAYLIDDGANSDEMLMERLLTENLAGTEEMDDDAKRVLFRNRLTSYLPKVARLDGDKYILNEEGERLAALRK